MSIPYTTSSQCFLLTSNLPSFFLHSNKKSLIKMLNVFPFLSWILILSAFSAQSSMVLITRDKELFGFSITIVFILLNYYTLYRIKQSSLFPLPNFPLFLCRQNFNSFFAKFPTTSNSDLVANAFNIIR